MSKEFEDYKKQLRLYEKLLEIFYQLYGTPEQSAADNTGTLPPLPPPPKPPGS